MYNLDKMEDAVKRMITLLADRHPGLSTWGTALARAVSDMNAATGFSVQAEEQARGALAKYRGDGS